MEPQTDPSGVFIVEFELTQKGETQITNQESAAFTGARPGKLLLVDGFYERYVAARASVSDL